MNKKILSLLLIFTMIFSTFTVALGASANEKIDWLVDNEYVLGDETGDLMLNNKITRAEVATMVARIEGLESVAETLKSVNSRFTDMNSYDVLWARGYVNAIEGSGIVNGHLDGTFKPKKNISYGEVIKMLVMVNGDIPETIETSGYWATPYVIKALEVGILDDMETIIYTEEATRGKIFEMVYNTVYNKLIEDDELDTYTALVTEVDKVYTMDENEMGVVILKTSKDNKYEIKDYTRLTFDNIQGHEDLLGKVIEVGIDNNNKIEKYEIDKSYDYLMGHVEFKKDSLIVDGKTYNVLLRDSAANVSDKVQFVYHNDKAIDYDDLVNKMDSDFARITIDRNRVIAIESFEFSKVQPIDEVDGNRVSFIEDRISIIDKALLLENGTLKFMDLKDIKHLDTGHVYGDNKLIVSREVGLTGELESVVSKPGKEIVVRIDGKEHPISDKFYMVYSVDGKNFITLDLDKAYDDLYLLRGMDIDYGLDASNNIKYILSAKVANEDFYIVDRISSRDVRLIDTNGTKIDYEVDLRTRILDNKGGRLGIMNLNPGDLVYMVKDGKYIEQVILVETFSNIKKSSVTVGKNSKGEFALDRKYELNKGVKSLVIKEDAKGFTEAMALEVDKVLANAKSDSKLKAYIFTDYDFDNLKLSRNVITSGEDYRINLILFTGFEQTLKGARKELVELRFDYKPNYDDEIEGYIDGELNRIKLEKDVRLESMNAGDHVLVYLNSDGKIMEGERIFKTTDKYVEVLDVEATSGKLSNIVVKENNVEKTYWASRDLIEVGITIKGSLVKFHLNSDNEIDIIIVK